MPPQSLPRHSDTQDAKCMSHICMERRHMHMHLMAGEGGSMHPHFDEIGKKVAPPDGQEKFFEKWAGYFERDADE